ncbi:NAD(P)-dependent oxidoreductase [Aneurinibacillus aneurinilyticus]|uniref:NAD(P)-dependent oxidoreductase n=1 Tax=Aneurinibacillus aneurinilyticus TaxID=1391 RepID=UPI0023F39BF3|nr:NAD(P)-dependent oxidoreductase [Aneurinibacillus aneurinilyticus]
MVNQQAFIPVEKLKKNFQEFIPGLREKDAMDEANRCLYCYDAPCIKACPTGINIPSFIKKIASGNMKGSARAIMEANPVGASCARVCPTSELCEGACVLNHASSPIMIGQLQRYATDWAMKNDVALFHKGESNGKTVAIIGGGPAGLSAARELARLGYKVTIYESKAQAGGLNTYGIVSFRLPQQIALWEVEQVEKLGVTILTGMTVGKNIQVEEIINGYDYVVLAVGLGNVPDLGIEGEELDGVYDAIQLVEDTKTKSLETISLGKRVVVIGAGNTAIDAATCSHRLGAEQVTIMYRRTEDEMTAYDFEYEFAKQEGIEFRWLVTPVRIIGDERGKVTALACVRMKLGEPDASGRPRPVRIEGSEFTVEVDSVIKAIGQNKLLPLVQSFGVEHVRGVIKVNGNNQTSNPKIFAAGDCIFGLGNAEAMVVDAAEQGKKAAYGIHKAYMSTRTEVLA